MSERSLGEATKLIQQGRLLEAQDLLKPIITADHHNMPAWLWFAETCSTSEQRLKVLEICLEYNPDSEEAKQVMEDLQAAIQRKEQVISSIKKQKAELTKRDFESIVARKEQVISSIKTLKAALALMDIKSVVAQREQAFFSVKKQFANGFLSLLKKIRPISVVLAVLLATAGLGSLAGRMLAAGAMFYIFGVLFVFTPLYIHFAIHASIIGLVNSKQIILKPLLFLGILSSHLSLFICFITQTDFDDSNGGAGITNLLELLNIKTVLANNLLDNLSLTFGLLLMLSWIVLGAFLLVGISKKNTISKSNDFNSGSFY